jgi:hypothetical protein
MRYGINTVVEGPRDLPPGTYFLSEPECYMDHNGQLTITYKVVVEHEHGTFGSHQHIGNKSIDDHRELKP